MRSPVNRRALAFFPFYASHGDSLVRTQSHAPTVLLVTQEDQIHGAMTDVLQDRGFGVGVAKCGRHAVELVRRDGEIDLLVAAMDLSDLDGITLAQLAQHHRPDLKVLLLCGGPSELCAAANFGHRGLKEPVEAGVLAAAVSDVAGQR
jgi:DNA-binding NtrC family response regulator